MLKHLFGKTPDPKTVNVLSVNGILPRQSADELLAGHHSVLNQIEELAGVPRDFYHRYYGPAIDNYACFVQQLPASESHHHAMPGGMLQHGLEVSMIALKKRRAFLLPSGANPEEITKKKDLWTYGIFCAALCHDIGKPAVDQLVTLYDFEGTEQLWNPWTGSMPESVVGYRISFRKDRVHGLHEKSALLMVNGILPIEGLAWISENLNLFHQWVSCIGGDHVEAGIIGEIVSGADRESVGKNLGAEFSSQSSHSRALSLLEKLLTGLRQLLNEGELPLNRNGAAGWLVGDDLWLVSKRAIDMLRAHLITEGHSGIPNRNDRIFDELQQRGVLISCNDRAIWRARVKGEDWEHELTFIRLPAGKIWNDPGARPAPFSGEIILDTKKTSLDESESDRSDTQMDQSLIEHNHVDSTKMDSHDLAPTNIPADDDPGKQFLEWLRKNIENGNLSVDVPNARIYSVLEGNLLVSPAIFKEFIENTGSQSSWEHAQKRFLKLKHHIKTPDGLNVHKRVVNGVALHGIVVPEFSIIDYQKSQFSSV